MIKIKSKIKSEIKSAGKSKPATVNSPLAYLAAIRDIMTHLETTQMPAIAQAADLIATALAGGNTVFCADIGHGLQGDFINRAGGLAGVQPFTFAVTVTSPVPECQKNRPRAKPFNAELENVRFAVASSNLRPGDVMLTGSVSGRNLRPVELALACRKAGVKTIGFTSRRYTAKVKSLHPSGKRLCEAVNVAIDTGVPYGDAAVEIPGLGIPALPASGAATVLAGWMMWAAVIDNMIAAGTPPTVFLSFNREGGEEFYKKCQAQYQQRGF